MYSQTSMARRSLFGTMQICSRHGLFNSLRDHQSADQEANVGIVYLGMSV